MIGVSQTVGV